MEFKTEGLRVFLNWWSRQLIELLPHEALRAFNQRPDAFIVDIDHAGLVLWLRRDGTVTRLARFGSDQAGAHDLAKRVSGISDGPHMLVVRPPRSSELRKTASFPLAARGDLENVLEFEMDRETPFARGEVYWTYEVQRVDQSAARLDVEMVIVPRAPIDVVIEALRGAGLHPNAIEIDLGSGNSRMIKVGASRRLVWLQSQTTLLRLAGIAASLVLLSIVLPFIRQQFALSSVESTIDSLTAEARDAASLRQSVEQAAQGLQLIKRERDSNGGALEVLAAATKLIPEDSHLTALSLRQGRMTVTGLSPTAAHLVDLLAASPAFREPTFDAPVVQDEASGLETFTISASLVPAGLTQQIGALPQSDAATPGAEVSSGPEMPKPIAKPTPKPASPASPATPAVVAKPEARQPQKEPGDEGYQ